MLFYAELTRPPQQRSESTNKQHFPDFKTHYWRERGVPGTGAERQIRLQAVKPLRLFLCIFHLNDSAVSPKTLNPPPHWDRGEIADSRTNFARRRC